WAVENGITSGTSATEFSPNMTCSQAHILTFLWRSVDKPASDMASPYSNANVTEDKYYYTPFVWAWEEGMVGNTKHDPNAPCSRADVVSYLWKLEGKPAAAKSNFTDVSANAEYADAVAWAVANGITSGTSKTTFSPNDTCTRGQIVSFLYRYVNGK
ncbi:MAG: S-layer homology domain-containing protein, partial [Anaerotignum sp.]|nr:S-layer homology domain-containing protein [Anaerotignum sp.]